MLTWDWVVNKGFRKDLATTDKESVLSHQNGGDKIRDSGIYFSEVTRLAFVSGKIRFPIVDGSAYVQTVFCT